MRNNETALKWVYSNNTFNLTEGTYDLKIYSDSKTDLDIVAVYTIKNKSSLETTDGQLQNKYIEDAFALDSNQLPSAQISEYEKINPTKYSVKINNATRPYIISLAESYDPLWEAYVHAGTSDNIDKGIESYYKTNSIPLYGLTNGFYINKIDDYSLIIEYQPQKWFV